MFKKLINRMLNSFGLHIGRIPDYERNMFVWLHNYNIATIFDVGANTGQFALEINNILPDARIYSFEPLKIEYQQLIKNTKRILKFEAFNIALGDTNESNTIHKHEFSPSSSLLKASDVVMGAYPYIGNSIGEEIMIRRLDDFVMHEHISLEPEIFIKLDVQGFEDRVIKGGRQTFKKAKVVLTEVSFQELYIGQALFDGIYYQLKDLGLEFKGIINTALRPGDGLPLYADALFIRNNLCHQGKGL